MDILKLIFEEKMLGDEDARSPALSFDLLHHHVDVVAPNKLYFVQIILILSAQMIVGALLAVVMWFGIIQPKCKKEPSAAAVSPLLVGYGVVIPLALFLPMTAVDVLDIRNVGLRLGCISLPMTITLRCLEAMHGFTPTATSLWEYVVSVGFILRSKLDNTTSTSTGTSKATTPITIRKMRQIANTHFAWMVAFTIVFNITMPSNFFPFKTKAEKELITFDVGQIYNTFVQAAMMNITLSLSLSGQSALASILSGVEYDDNVTNFPMFLSTSPSDFWGRRWNNLIHTDLKLGVYKPVRFATGNKLLASVAAFCMSGMLHEYVWKILFLVTSAQAAETAKDGGCCPSCYCDSWVGKQLIFFGWNGALIGLEYLIGDKIAACTSFLPSLLRSHLVVLLSLPVGHLFTQDITRANFFQGLQYAVPLVTVTEM
mmetsp:Transcript_14946/g.19565  ORF Transcript_14946/g.19565 Transcript_14946/m.19565 type:complete len:429 (-) Transcript_14946:192-1478(-)|eukprot:CAMPEP_0198149352 /NCGR_PEP_ID=MMETSP1443-20131203/46134_1 /TAXON_ID=186043 /ORGANISM="Entomoneis sp., Strain CCMP2396" /LENGTH=428 /DNA_ID=CAMNT_0043814355 /DNA_START=58 /DNA_END=1344 /DNA_ORIENTATION=+